MWARKACPFCFLASACPALQLEYVATSCINHLDDLLILAFFSWFNLSEAHCFSVILDENFEHSAIEAIPHVLYSWVVEDVFDAVLVYCDLIERLIQQIAINAYKGPSNIIDRLGLISPTQFFG
jgi:hypothetical protein